MGWYLKSEKVNLMTSLEERIDKSERIQTRWKLVFLGVWKLSRQLWRVAYKVKLGDKLQEIFDNFKSSAWQAKKTFDFFLNKSACGF